MKILQKITALLITTVLVTSFAFSAFADSITYEIPDLDLTVTVPEGTYIFDSSFSSLDQTWSEAGITTASDYLSLYEDLNVYAHFSTNEGLTNVYVSKTESDTTQAYYSFLEMEQSELDALLEEYTAVEDTSSVVATLVYVGEVPFISLDIWADMSDGTFIYERAVFTIINGYTVSFGINTYEEFSQEDIVYLESIYTTAEFTNIIPYADTALTFTQALLILIGLIILIGGVIVFIIKIGYDSKKMQKETKILAEKISTYRKFVNDNPSMKRNMVFQNTTILTEKLVKEYSIYNCYLKRGISTGISLIITIACCISAFFLSLEWWVLLLFCAGLAFCLYQVIFSGSKLQKTLRRVHSKYLSKKAVYRFYEDDFSVSGIQYLEYYAYFQLTEFREYKNEFYLYFGPNNCLFVSKNGFSVAEEADFKAFITRKMKREKAKSQ